jgi:sulfate adenylyltransferase subunit 2
MSYVLPHLALLEAESIYVLREVAAQFERPVLLFSGGKDSIALVRIAEKAFRPATFPFSVMHVDTGHNFPEVIAFRDQHIERLGEPLIVASVQESLGRREALLRALSEHRFDAAVGGARRHVEPGRATGGVFSFRDQAGLSSPRPDLWHLYNGRIKRGEHVHVSPISNWTELDVWAYIAQEKLEVPSIYFAHEREVFERDGMLLAVTPFLEHLATEPAFREWVRYRSVGDATCTGAVRSRARTIAEVQLEITSMRVTRDREGHF